MSEISKPATEPAATTASVPFEPAKKPPAETGGPKGLEPTRYGDWERKGKCVDF